MLYAKDFRRLARESLAGKWPLSILICIIATILGGSASSSQIFTMKFNKDNTIMSGQLGGFTIFDCSVTDLVTGILASVALGMVIYGIVIFLIGSAIEIGQVQYFIRNADHGQGQLNDLTAYLHIFGKALGLRIIMTVFICLWSLLLVIPGIIAAYRYSMAVYLMAENPDIGIMEAIDKSKELMAGNKWRFFCLDFSFIGWGILSSLTFGIGYLFLNPYVAQSHAEFYLNLTGRIQDTITYEEAPQQ